MNKQGAGKFACMFINNWYKINMVYSGHMQIVISRRLVELIKGGKYK